MASLEKEACACASTVSVLDLISIQLNVCLIIVQFVLLTADRPLDFWARLMLTRVPCLNVEMTQRPHSCGKAFTS